MKKILVVGVILLFLGSGLSIIAHSSSIKDATTVSTNYSLNPLSRMNWTQDNHWNKKDCLGKYNSIKKNTMDNDIESFTQKESTNFNLLQANGNNSIIYVPDDYPTIELAVNHAQTGDEIIVRNGSYSEAVTVDKSLTIQSEHYLGAYIAQVSSNNIFTVTADFVTISGFNLFGNYASCGIRLESSNNTNISYNQIRNLQVDIRVIDSINDSIHDNALGYLWDLDDWGVYVENSKFIQVYNNTMNSESWSCVFLGTTNNSHIFNNNFCSDYGVISLRNSTNNTFEHNYFHASFWADFPSDSCHFYDIENNTFENPTVDGIIEQNCDHFTIKNNSFTNDGIWITNSPDNTIENNTVNGKELLYLEEKTNVVIDNKIGQVILINCSNIIMRNLTLSHSTVGCELMNTNNCTIYNCSSYANNDENIFSGYSEDVTIQNLNFGDSIYGIVIWHCQRTKIANCIGEYDCEVDFYIDGSPDTTLYHNQITVSMGNWGMEVFNSNNLSMSYNLVSNLNNIAIRISNVSNSRIFYNQFTPDYQPILLLDCNKITFYRNDISDSTIGLALINCQNCQVKENNLNNWHYGFEKGKNNHWFHNYWGQPFFLPYPIFTDLPSLPLIRFDWHPALSPFDIPKGGFQ
jgi:parallel beta-helix repeat protein